MPLQVAKDEIRAMVSLVLPWLARARWLENEHGLLFVRKTRGMSHINEHIPNEVVSEIKPSRANAHKVVRGKTVIKRHPTLAFRKALKPDLREDQASS